MKELTTEQKAQRYDEALELAAKFRKEYLNYKELNVHKGVIEAFNSIFPELKESEDERIRKAIIEFFELQDGNTTYSFIPKKDILAWLEKIGKNTTNKGEPNLLTHERVMEISPFMRSGFENEDKVEPKFHKEDWVVWDNKISCHVDNIYQGKNSLMYTITDTNNMTRSYSVKGFDNNAHLWTINDAKDGDVLIFEGFYNSIVLFQGIGINGKGRINYHCKCDLGNYSFGVQGDVACLGTVERDAEHYHPATKEQRDTLMKAMTDAGYTFDFEKKKLKKIEQKPATWSEEDEGFLMLLLAIFTNEHPNGIFTTDNITVFKGSCVTSNRIIAWLKSLKDRYAWKPSKIQLETLKELSHDFPTKRGTIEEILKHLKQL